MKQKAKRNAMEAFNQDRAKTQLFDSVSSKLCLSDTPQTLENPQPSIFKGVLKGYQLKGMNWLANLYGQVRKKYLKCLMCIEYFLIKSTLGYQWYTR